MKPRNIQDLFSFHMFNKVLAIFILLFSTAYLILSAPFSFPKEETFEVKNGMSLARIAEKLDDENIIRFKKPFILFVKLFKDERNIKAGLYYFERPLGLVEVANRLIEGKNGIGLAGITIIEGQNLRDIGKIFEEKNIFHSEDILKSAAEDFAGDFSFLSDKPKILNLEGYLFPDTYFFPPNIGPENVIRAMLENFGYKLTPELRTEIAKQNKTIFETVTMASIIEREASDPEDRKIISGILWKRAKAGMALQADATLNYLTGKKSSELTSEDLQIDSPYNTYKYPGLPFGPISNPGLNAIEVAVFPKDTPYWFYLHDKNGNPHYAKTFEEHKTNKEKYLR